MATKEQLRDPNYMPPITSAVPLGIQHILAMFVSNVTPAIIVAGAAGFGFGKPDMGQMIYMIQMCMFFAGIATLMQTVGLGPIGSKLPIVQGTSFAFIPVMIPIVAGQGVDAMAGLMGGIVAGGIFHMFLGTIISRIRSMLPPLITGLIVLMIGLALIKVGIQYAAGGVPAIGKPEFVTADMVKEGAVVIDVGINRVKDASKKSGYKLANKAAYANIVAHQKHLDALTEGLEESNEDPKIKAWRNETLTSLLKFAKTYRSLNKITKLNLSKIKIIELFENIKTLMLHF